MPRTHMFNGFLQIFKTDAYQGKGRMMVTRSQAAIPTSTVFVADFMLDLGG